MRCRNRSHVWTYAAHHVIAHHVGDGARICGLGDSGVWIDEDVRRARDSKAEHRVSAILPRLGPDLHRQESLNWTHPEGRLIPVMLYAPGENADLVEIERQA